MDKSKSGIEVLKAINLKISIPKIKTTRSIVHFILNEQDVKGLLNNERCFKVSRSQSYL